MKKTISTLILLTMLSGTASAAVMNTGYTKGPGSQLLVANGGSGTVLFADYCALGGSDVTDNDGYNNEFTVFINGTGFWSAGDTVEITGFALPVRNTSVSGTMTFDVLQGAGGSGASGAGGLASLGTATASLTGGITDEHYVNFDTPVSFVANANSKKIGINFSNTALLRIKASNAHTIPRYNKASGNWPSADTHMHVSLAGKVTIGERPENPLAEDDSYSTFQNMPYINIPPIGVLANDVDYQGDPLTAILVADVSNGSLTLNPDGSFSYTPGTNYTGDDSFTYKANDGTNDSNVATVTISVLPSTEHYRVIWDNDPTSTATIAWKQVAGSNGTVHYGTNDFGTAYTNYPNQKTVDRVGNFNASGQILSCFANLTGLQPDTAYYFVITDNFGVSDRFWFLTAPDTPKPFTFIGGGDSRTNIEPRRKANRMVAKLRPLFVYFTGDMINTSTAAQWNEWFEHWQETICADGRIIPLIPHRGNHEGYNASDNAPFFELFDTTAENYFSFSIGGNLMRYYVLNSEMDDNPTKWNAQTAWLTSDLTANAASHTHLAAGYHKPMRPHNAAKSEGNNEYDAWAQPFYTYGMDLVFEADSHTVKRTWPIRPYSGPGSDGDFIRDDANGTVYSGEGCWGAPLRANDDLKNWTRDSGVFDSFDWVHVYPSYMEMYTIKVDNESGVGNLQEGDVFSLPSGIDLWQPPNGMRVIINNHAGTTLKSYAQWQFDQWGPAIPANTDALSDFDGDGYNNLTEFAYGLNPKTATPAEPGIFPIIAVTPGTQIGISYRREVDTSLSYVYEFSSDLITWDPMVEGVDFSQTSSPTGTYEQVSIDLLGEKETAAMGFIRITYGIQ